ncbi:MAG: serine hydrolase domain-containing protein [Runella sp.]
MRLLLLLFTICSTISAFAQTYLPPVFDDAQRLERIKSLLPAIDKIYKEYAEQHHFPGFAYGVVVDGQLIHKATLGYCDVEKKNAVTTRSVFRIASMSKSFTTLAILQLRDAGKLRLDDPAEKYIPELRNVRPLTTDAPKITIRHLLTHAAGFPEDNPWGDRQLTDTDADLLRLLRSSPSFSNVPGITYEYSNLGITLLGYIITKVSGKPYQQYINEKILKPLGMKDTYWEYAQVPSEQLALGYRRYNDQWQKEPLLHDGAYGAMGGMLSSVEDFAKYMALHLSAWPPRNDTQSPIISRASLREMHFPWSISGISPNYKFPNGRPCATVSAYGYGLNWLRDCDNRVFVGHSGGLPGFGSNWRILPEYGIGVVCFANVTYAPTTPLNLRVLDTLIVGAKLTPRQLPPSDVLKQRQQQLNALLPHWQNAENSGIFAENFFADYVLEDLRKESQKLFEKAGKILNIGKIKPENQLRGAYTLEGEKTNLHIHFTLSPENPALIQAFRIEEKKKEQK